MTALLATASSTTSRKGRMPTASSPLTPRLTDRRNLAKRPFFGYITHRHLTHLSAPAPDRHSSTSLAPAPLVTQPPDAQNSPSQTAPATLAPQATLANSAVSSSRKI
jgi:hypothetical protein